MPRKARELSPLEVPRLVKPGRWSVGGVDGLALQVTGSRARSWVLRIRVAGRQREMGLGSFPSVTLAEAREQARAFRLQIDSGDDPIAKRLAAISAAAAERSTLKTFAKTVLRRMKVQATVHGFRSSFRDWVAESTACCRSGLS